MTGFTVTRRGALVGDVLFAGSIGRTDFPYGEIVWQRGSRRAAVRLDVGCRSPEMQAVVQRAQQAQNLPVFIAQTL